MRYTIPQEMDYEYLNDLIASGYEPFDWAAVYDYPPDIPPTELVEACAFFILSCMIID